MFKLAVNPFFWTEVKISLVGDMGKFIDATFKAKYKRLTQQEYEELAKSMALPSRPIDEALAKEQEEAAAAEGRPIAWRVTDKEVLDRVLLDWADLLDEDDKALPYTPDNLERMEAILGARATLVQTFFEAHVKAPAKNSARPRGASTA